MDELVWKGVIKVHRAYADVVEESIDQTNRNFGPVGVANGVYCDDNALNTQNNGALISFSIDLFNDSILVSSGGGKVFSSPWPPIMYLNRTNNYI